MNRCFQSLSSLCFAIICIIGLGLAGCENPGSVGRDLGGPGGKVVIDTVMLKGIQSVSAPSYSGGLSYFTTGQFDDPLFGNMKASGYLKPSLPNDSQQMNEDATMLMRLIMNTDQVYGDSTRSQKFGIYEIDELWRRGALKVNQELQLDSNNKLGEFSVGKTDSVDVNLSEMAPDWVDRYYSFASDSTNGDSLYVAGMNGLALVPENSEKLIPVNIQPTRFMIQNPEADTFRVGVEHWGYSMQRDSDTSFPQGSLPLYSTYEKVLNFQSLELSNFDVSVSGLSKAELVLHQNTDALEQSFQSQAVSPLAHRPVEQTIYLQVVDPGHIPDNIDPGPPLGNGSRVQGTYSASDGTYRFDITNLVGKYFQQGLTEGQELYITFPNTGIVKSGLIYSESDQVMAEKKPKIVITYLKNTSK